MSRNKTVRTCSRLISSQGFTGWAALGETANEPAPPTSSKRIRRSREADWPVVVAALWIPFPVESAGRVFAWHAAAGRGAGVPVELGGDPLPVGDLRGRPQGVGRPAERPRLRVTLERRLR